MTSDKQLLEQVLEALESCMYPQQKQLQAITAIKQALAAPVQEPVAFKIYKPTPPRGATPSVQDAELPWVYDQDPSSGSVASMWVTPVNTKLKEKNT